MLRMKLMEKVTVTVGEAIRGLRYSLGEEMYWILISSLKQYSCSYLPNSVLMKIEIMRMKMEMASQM